MEEKLTLEDTIRYAVKSIRKMYKNDPRYYDIVKREPRISVAYNRGKIALECISFDYYDGLNFFSNMAIYIPEHNNSYEILHYKGWKGLISLGGVV